MDPIEQSPADALRECVALLHRKTPFLLSSALGRLPERLDTWVQSVETRLAALQKMPSADALRILTTMPMRDGGPTAEEYAARGNKDFQGVEL